MTLVSRDLDSRNLVSDALESTRALGDTPRRGVRQKLLSFDTSRREPSTDLSRPDSGIFEYYAHSYTTFLPLGLFLSGVTDETRLYDLLIGNTCQLFANGDNWAGLPGKYFETKRSFVELERLAQAGELGSEAALHTRFQMTEAYEQGRHRLRLSGPVSGALLWGVVGDGGEPLRMSVTAQKGEFGAVSGFVGTLYREKLTGDVLVASVRAETESGAIALLRAAHAPHHGRW